jgi:single-strand DNA-binding protein
MYQHVMIIGNLGQDPEVRMTPNGQPVAQVSVAVSEKWKGKDGNQQERTEWFRVVVWGKLAELVGKYCRKGEKVMFTGRMQTSSWEKDGHKQYKTEMIADEMKLLGSKRDDSQSGAPSGQYGASAGYAAGSPHYGASAYSGSEDKDVPF